MSTSFLLLRRAFAAPVLACVLAALAACGMLDTQRKIEKPPPTLVSGSGATVTVDDDQSGSPVDLRAHQTLTVRLRQVDDAFDDWILIDFQPGVLSQIGKARFEQDLGAGKSGGVTGTKTWRFAAAAPGQVTLRFELRVPRSRDPAKAVASFAVTVR